MSTPTEQERLPDAAYVAGLEQECAELRQRLRELEMALENLQRGVGEILRLVDGYLL